MNFFKTFLASCLGSLLAMVALLILVFGFFSIIIAGFSSDGAQTVVDSNSVLHLKLNGLITETEVEDPLEGLPLPGVEEAPIGLLQLKKSLAHAENDPAIEGIYLDVSHFQGGYAVAKEIR